MKSTIENPKELKLENENNKFSCDIISQLTLAPTFGENDFYGGIIGSVFLVVHENEKMLLELVHYDSIPFLFIDNTYTLPICGMEEKEWKEKFIKKYPPANNDTRIGIFCYRKLKL